MQYKVDVLLPNTSQYGVLHHFAKKIHEAFTTLGYESRLLSKDVYSSLLYEDPPHFTFGFNGAPRDEFGEFLCETAFVPHISCLVDPPYRFMDLQSSPYIYITCDDRVCVDMFRSEMHPNYFFFPHGVEKGLEVEADVERIYECVFLGTYINPESHIHQWDKQFPQEISRLMKEVVKEVLNHEGLHFMQAFLEVMNQRKPEPFFNLTDVLQEIELYLKACDRLNLLKSITHIPIHVFGGSLEDIGWESLAFQSNLIIHDPINYEEALNVIKRSKVVLNSGIKNIFGAHERVFSGLASGAVVMTNQNAFLQETLQDEESILFYKHTELHSVEEKIQGYLSDDSKRIALAKKGQAIAFKFHTWEERLRTFLPQILSGIIEI